jgi:hypothetical protein
MIYYSENAKRKKQTEIASDFCIANLTHQIYHEPFGWKSALRSTPTHKLAIESPQAMRIRSLVAGESKR